MERWRFEARRVPHALRYRWRSAFSKWDGSAGASGFSGGHSANPQHGDARRKHLSGYALQLLRSKLRVEEVDQFLPEKRRNDLLGRAGKFEVPGGVLDGYGPGADGARGPGSPRVTFRRARSPSFRSVQQRRDRLHQAQTG